MSLKDTRNLLIEKCKECSKICDFSSEAKDVKAKSTKTVLLKQISSSFTNPHISKTLSTDVINSFLSMIEANIFRTFPTIRNVSQHSDFTDSIQDSAWPHISLVYDCLNSSLKSPIVKEFPPNFLKKIVDNILSPDERERKETISVLNGIYARNSSARSVIRQRCSYIFSNQKCSSELLDFFDTVAASFSPPLKDETIEMYVTEILPLHSLDNYPQYSQYLLRVINRFISKAESLLKVTLSYLNSHWPRTNRLKQSIFLREYEDLVIAFENRMTKELSLQFFRKINQCIEDQSSEVVNASFEVLQNPSLRNFIMNNAQNLYLMLILSIGDVLDNSWNIEIKETAKMTLEILCQIQPEAFKRAVDMKKSMKSFKKPFDGISKIKWKKVLDAAKALDPSLSNLQVEDLCK